MERLFTHEHEKHVESMYFKEYLGSIALRLAAKFLTDEEVSALFDEVDSLNGPDHPYYEQHKKIRDELRENFEKSLKEHRENLANES